jgi:hypothetical protein
MTDAIGDASGDPASTTTRCDSTTTGTRMEM